jgi:hypothetical protein
MEITATRRDSLASWCAGVAAAGMEVAGLFHVVWAFHPWPLATWLEWNRTIMGSGDPTVRTGPDWVLACFLISGLLTAAAYIVGVRAGLFPRFGPWWAFRIAAWCVVIVLAARGVLGYVAAAHENLPFAFWNRILYSPLCLVLAALSTVAIICHGRSRS